MHCCPTAPLQLRYLSHIVGEIGGGGEIFCSLLLLCHVFGRQATCFLLAIIFKSVTINVSWETTENLVSAAYHADDLCDGTLVLVKDENHQATNSRDIITTSSGCLYSIWTFLKDCRTVALHSPAYSRLNILDIIHMTKEQFHTSSGQNFRCPCTLSPSVFLEIVLWT